MATETALTLLCLAIVVPAAIAFALFVFSSRDQERDERDWADTLPRR